MRTSTGKFVLAGVLAIISVVAACHFTSALASDGQVRQVPTASSSLAAPVPSPASASPSAVNSASQPVTTSSSTALTPGSSVSGQPTQSVAPTPKFVPVPAPADTSAFTLEVDAAEAGHMSAEVGTINVPPHTQVVPPEPEGTDWMHTSVRPLYSEYPTAPAVGTTISYGHACQHHDCPFSAVQRKADGSYTVKVGDQLVARTPLGVMTYTACAVGSSPKSGDLVLPQGCTYQPALVLVTCQYDGDVSNDNIVVAARLIGSVALAA